jgi:hypothetical protein
MKNTIRHNAQDRAIGLVECTFVVAFLAAVNLRAGTAPGNTRPTISVYGVKAIGVSRELGAIST